MQSQTTPVTVQITVNSSLQKVWNYFTEPVHITQWYFAADTWHAPAAENDLRTGGKFKTRMEAKDGSFGFDFEGSYTNVQLQKQIDYNIADGRKVQITFEETANGIVVTEIFEAETQNPVDMQRTGWQMILDNFKTYTEGN